MVARAGQDSCRSAATSTRVRNATSFRKTRDSAARNLPMEKPPARSGVASGKWCGVSDGVCSAVHGVRVPSRGPCRVGRAAARWQEGYGALGAALLRGWGASSCPAWAAMLVAVRSLTRPSASVPAGTQTFPGLVFSQSTKYPLSGGQCCSGPCLLPSLLGRPWPCFGHVEGSWGRAPLLGNCLPGWERGFRMIYPRSHLKRLPESSTEA